MQQTIKNCCQQYYNNVLCSDNMNQNLIKWIGTITTIISAAIVSISPHLATYPGAFVGYLIGAACWLFYAYKINDYPMGVLNAFYLVLNGFAIYTRL